MERRSSPFWVSVQQWQIVDYDYTFEEGFTFKEGTPVGLALYMNARDISFQIDPNVGEILADLSGEDLETEIEGIISRAHRTETMAPKDLGLPVRVSCVITTSAFRFHAAFPFTGDPKSVEGAAVRLRGSFVLYPEYEGGPRAVKQVRHVFNVLRIREIERLAWSSVADEIGLLVQP